MLEAPYAATVPIVDPEYIQLLPVNGHGMYNQGAYLQLQHTSYEGQHQAHNAASSNLLAFIERQM